MSRPPPTSVPWTRRILAYGIAALFAFGLSSLIVNGCRADTAIRESASGFLADVRAGRVEAAHARMTSARRARMTSAELDALTDHPAFRRGSAGFGQIEAWGDLGTDEGCIDGSLTVDGEDWGLQMYLRAEGDVWRVESFAIQPPAMMQLADLVPECGYWEGSTMGYSGPPIERTTRPVRPTD